MPIPRTDEDNGLLDGIESTGDGSGIGSTLSPDLRTDAERREVERKVFQQRTAKDKAAEEALSNHKGPGR